MGSHFAWFRTLALIVKNIIRDISDYTFFTQEAAVAGRVDIVEKIVQFATDPNPSGVFGRTPLHVAAQGFSSNPFEPLFRVRSLAEPLHLQQHYAIVKLIIEKVQNKNPADYNGTTPLHCAALRGDIDLFNLILEHAANKNPNSPTHRTPLHLAAREGHVKVCKAILENVEDQHPKDIDGRTPLHWAAKNGHVKVCRLLLASGNVEVARHQEDFDRYTPLKLARDNRHYAVVKLFKAGRQ